MSKLRFYLWAAVVLTLLSASPSAAANYKMSKLKDDSGFRSEIFETVTASDFLFAEATGFMRLAFTQGDQFEATVYACETNVYAAGTCTSLATLDASTNSLELKTGKPWIVIDVTTAESVSNVSYITIRGHPSQAGSGGGGVLGTGTYAEMVAANPSVGESWVLTDDDATGSDCDAGGTPATPDLPCWWNGSNWVPFTGSISGLTNPLTADMNAGGFDITNVNEVDGRDVSVDGTKLDGIETGATADQTDAEILAAWESETGRDVSVDMARFDNATVYYCQDYSGGDIGAQCNAAYAAVLADNPFRGAVIELDRGNYTTQITKIDFCDETGVTGDVPILFRGQMGGVNSKGGPTLQAHADFKTTAITASMTTDPGTGTGGRDVIDCATCTFFTDGIRRGDLLEITGFTTNPAANNFGLAQDKLPAKVFSVGETELVIEGEDLDAGLIAETATASVRQLKAQIEICDSHQFVENMTLRGGTQYADIGIHARPDNALNEQCLAGTDNPVVGCTDVGAGSLTTNTGIQGGVDRVYMRDQAYLGVAITAPNVQGQWDHFVVSNSSFDNIPIMYWQDNAQSQPGTQSINNSYIDFEWAGNWCSSGTCRSRYDTYISDAADCDNLVYGECSGIHYSTTARSIELSSSNIDVWGGTAGIQVEDHTFDTDVTFAITLRDNVIQTSFTSAEEAAGTKIINAPQFCGIFVNSGNLYTNNAGPTTGGGAPEILIGSDQHPSTCETVIEGKSAYRDRLAPGPIPVLTVNNGIYQVPDEGDDVTWTGAHDFGGATLEIPNSTVSGLGTATLGRLAIVTDGSDADDCTTGSGSTVVQCMANGSTWEPTGDSGAGGSSLWTDHGTFSSLTDNSTIANDATGTTFSITEAGVATFSQAVVDNLSIDGNTITATSGAANITPAAGSAVVLDGTISVDAGVVTGATSITSTTFVGALSGAATQVGTAAGGDTTSSIAILASPTGDQAVLTDTGITWNATTNDLTVTGTVIGSSVAVGTSDTAEVRLTSATDGGDVAVKLTEGATTNNTVMNLTVQDDGTAADVPYVRLDGEGKAVDIGIGEATTTIGDGGTTNYIQVTAAGVQTFVGSADINLPDDSVDIADLSATGTASSSTFLRGDNQWATPAGGGTVTETGTQADSQIAVFTGDTDLDSSASLTFDGTTFTATNTTIDAGGVDVATGDTYAVNSVDVLTATTLGSSVVNSSLTSLGTQGENLVMGSNSITGVPQVDAPGNFTVQLDTADTGDDAFIIQKFESAAASIVFSVDETGVTEIGSDGTGIDGVLRIWDENGGTDTSVSIQALDGGANNYTLTLPPNDGDASQFLQTDGAGVLVWANPAGSGTLTGDGTATYVPYYSGTQVLANEAAFNYNASTDTLTAGTFSGGHSFSNVTTGTNATTLIMGNGGVLQFNTTTNGTAYMIGTDTIGADPGIPANGITIGTTGIIFEGAANASEGLLTLATLSADRTWTLPNLGGTILTDGAAVTVAQGGTGRATLTADGALYGNGTGLVGMTAAHTTNGSLLIGDGSGVPTVATITGTANEITVTNGAGSITLDIPDSPVLTTPNIGAATGTSLTLSGDLQGLVPHTITTGTTHSPAETAMRGDWHFYSNAGIVTVTLPAISGDGNSACFHDRDGTAVLRIDPNASDNIILTTAAMTDGEYIESAGAAGDFICLLEYDASSWIALGRSGTWVEETP